jgi:hypothetical protein
VKIGPLEQDKQKKKRITAAEMKYTRKTAGYTWTDHKTNTETAKELNITAVLDTIQDYKRNWIHVNRMPRNRLPRIMKNTHQKAEGTREDHGRDWNGSTSGPTA